MNCSRTEWQLLLSCEHGGNEVPADYAGLFAGAGGLLATHAGYDIGALGIAKFLAAELRAPLYAATVTRLLIDLNRSPGHPRQYSALTRELPAAERARIRDRYYLPFRTEVETALAAAMANGRVLHLSVHSFAAELDGQQRACDVGLLYDPSRAPERAFCQRWQVALRAAARCLRVRRNYPYRGVSDGFVTWLRRRFPRDRYAGIELEVNQALALAGGRPWNDLLRALADSLASSLAAASGRSAQAERRYSRSV